MDDRGQIYTDEQIQAMDATMRSRLTEIPASALATVQDMGPDARKAWVRDRHVCGCKHRRGMHSKHGSGACKERDPSSSTGARCPCKKMKRVVGLFNANTSTGRLRSDQPNEGNSPKSDGPTL